MPISPTRFNTVQVVASGTQTASISTEHTLATVTEPGIYRLVVDLNALVNGDTVSLNTLVRVLSGGTDYYRAQDVYANAIASPHYQSDDVWVAHQAVFKLLQSAGTGRDFPWAIWKVA